MNRASRAFVGGRCASVASLSFTIASILLLAGVLAAVLPSPALAQNVTLRTVAVSGQAAPDGGGAPFYFFDLPSLNDAGQVSFNAWLPPAPGDNRNVMGIWSGPPGALGLNAMVGRPSTAPNEPPYEGLSTTTVINAGGEVLFGAAFRPTKFSPSPNGLFRSRAGDAAAPGAIAATGMEAPEARSKQFFDTIDLYPPRLGAGGHAAFTGRLGGKEIEERVNDTGVWGATPGENGRQLVARAGREAPGAGKGVLFSENQFTSGVAFHAPAVDRHGNVVFVANLRGTDVSELNSRGVWFAPAKSDQPVMVARQGDFLATGSSVQYQGVSIDPTIANGRIAFHSTMYGPPPRDGTGNVAVRSDSERFDAIVAGPPDALKIFAATLTRPTSAASFSGFGAPVMNGRGDVLFQASLAFDGQQEMVGSLWAASQAGRRLLVTEGDAAPGSAAGVVFGNFSSPSVNDTGGFAFVGDLRGAGVSESNDRGIWVGSIGTDLDDGAANALSPLRLVVREGDVLDLGDGLSRTVRSIEMIQGSNGGENGGASGFNHLGELAFVARFTDGSNAVIIAVPEPAATMLLLSAILLARPRRRHPRMVL